MQNRGYSADWLYQLKQKNNIVTLISKYIRLDKKGKRYWGCCPFHNEKTPSFSVSEEEGLFYCFGCKESGDAISFLMKMESCDFSDAIKILANNAHMEIPEFVGTKEDVSKKQEKERLLKLLDVTYKHYQQNLYTKEAKPAQDYIKLRGFTRHELEDFRLGYSLDLLTLPNYLRKMGFTYKEMLDAGVCQKKDDKFYYDVNSGRLVFPIFNSFDECIGFSARVLGKSDYAKYKNTSETPVFHKGRVVFGINLLKKLKQQQGLTNIIIVEGQIDVVAMHRAGFKNTVACMGTALTSENAYELKKLSNEIILCFDGDEAGTKATLRSIDILKNEGCEVKIVSLPQGQDPDEILKMYGKEKLQEFISNALPIIDYQIEIEKKKFDLTKADEKGAFAKAVIEHIRKLESMAEAEPYLAKLRDLTAIPIDVLRRDLQRGQAKKEPVLHAKKEEDGVLISRENGNIRAIKYVLSSLIYQKEYVKQNLDYAKLIPSAKKIIEKAQERIAVSSYYDHFNVEENPILKDCLVFNFEEFSNIAQRYFDECVWLLADAQLKNIQKDLTEKFKTCQDLNERQIIVKKLTEVTKQLREKSLEEFYVR